MLMTPALALLLRRTGNETKYPRHYDPEFCFSWMDLLFCGLYWIFLCFSGGEGALFSENLHKAFLNGVSMNSCFCRKRKDPGKLYLSHTDDVCHLTPALITGAFVNRVYL